MEALRCGCGKQTHKLAVEEEKQKRSKAKKAAHCDKQRRVFRAPLR